MGLINKGEEFMKRKKCGKEFEPKNTGSLKICYFCDNYSGNLNYEPIGNFYYCDKHRKDAILKADKHIKKFRELW